jgi:hypothetical protein
MSNASLSADAALLAFAQLERDGYITREDGMAYPTQKLMDEKTDKDAAMAWWNTGSSDGLDVGGLMQTLS